MGKEKKIGVIQFPGSNCEAETVAAINYYGMSAVLLHWSVSESEFFKHDGFVIPGGFSFQDRIRAGVIASRLPIMDFIVRASHELHPILGICNGCQILAESGLVPDTLENQTIEMALAPNQKNGDSLGFYCDWVFVKPNAPHQNIFTRLFETEDVIPVPVNHGEGRFIFNSSEILPFSSFQYCDDEGKLQSSFPTNPNGSSHNIAGIGNKNGNVFAMMPHPERAYLSRQIPDSIPGEWPEKKATFFNDEANAPGPWEKLFLALKAHER